MKNLLKLISSVAILVSLTACGGGSSTPAADTSGSAAITAIIIKDTVVGTGNTVTAGKSVTINYVAYLYDVNALDTKGKFIDSSTSHGSTLTFTQGGGAVITGLDQGMLGMRVGGKRTLTVPAALAYGSAGQTPVPPNAAMVFDLDLVSVQ